MHNIFPNFGFFLLSDIVRMFFRESVREFGYFVKFMWSCDGFAILNPARERGIRLQKAKILASQRDKIGVWKIFKGIVVAWLRQISIIIDHVIDVATLRSIVKGWGWFRFGILDFFMMVSNDLHDDDDDRDDNGKFVALWSKAEEGGREGLPPPGPFHALWSCCCCCCCWWWWRWGSLWSRKGRVYKRNWTEWLCQWVVHP